MVTLKMQCRGEASRLTARQPRKNNSKPDGWGKRIWSTGRAAPPAAALKTFVCYSCEEEEEDEEGGAVNRLRVCLWLKSADAQQARPKKYQSDELRGREEALPSVFKVLKLKKKQIQPGPHGTVSVPAESPPGGMGCGGGRKAEYKWDLCVRSCGKCCFSAAPSEAGANPWRFWVGWKNLIPVGRQST